MKNTTTLRDSPAYRAAYTPQSCTTVELLAAVIGGSNASELADMLLKAFNGDWLMLSRAPAEDLAALPGFGLATAARIRAAFAMGHRYAIEFQLNQRPDISNPSDAAALVGDMAMLEQEELWVMLLDTRNRLIEIEKLYRGSINSTQIKVGEVFRAAIRRNAPAVIIFHNHPSGDPAPSPDDVAITRAIVQAGKLMDILVMDHIVIGANRHVSLKERGLGFV